MKIEVEDRRPVCSSCAAHGAIPASDTGLAFCSECADKLATTILALDEVRLLKIWRTASHVGVPARTRKLTPEEAGTHADLGIAYLEMSLTADAFGQALVVLTTGEESPIAVGLFILFSPKLLVGKPADVLALVMPS